MSAPDDSLEAASLRFVVAESALLDDGRWDDWRALFAAGGTYWMPLDPAQPDAVHHVSLVYDNAQLMDLSCRRLRDAAGDLSSLSLQPLPRVLRFLSNLVVERCDAATIEIRGLLIAVQYAAGVTRSFHARVRWTLERQSGRLAIRQKRVELLNADDNLPDILVYL